MIRRAIALPLFAALSLTGGLLVAGCGGDNAGGPPAGGAAPPGGATTGGPSAASGNDGASVFASNCAGCHGPDGAKNGHFARLSGEKDAGIKATIENGKGPMPSFKGKLTEEQITAVIAHVKTLGG